jgi:hypothetical protein
LIVFFAGFVAGIVFCYYIDVIKPPYRVPSMDEIANVCLATVDKVVLDVLGLRGLVARI